jgi:hypothetical protein
MTSLMPDTTVRLQKPLRPGEPSRHGEYAKKRIGQTRFQVPLEHGFHPAAAWPAAV